VEDAKKQTAEDSTGNYIYRVRGAPRTMKVLRFRRSQKL